MSETKNISLKGLRTFLRPLMNLINRKAETWDDLKKKPFGSEYKEVTLYDGSVVVYDYLWNETRGDPINFEVQEGVTYTVTIDGTEYQVVGVVEEYGNCYIGSYNLWMNTGSWTNAEVPFCYGDGWFGAPSAGTYSVKITGQQETITKLPEKYLDFDTSDLVKSVNGATPDDYGDVYLTLSNISGNLPISKGGTGASTVANARGNLGLGYTSGAVPIANGGTGATTAATALTNLGITATSAELNKMDGVTATTAELNYVNGVTSNIQTQLNAKVPTTRTINGKALSENIVLSGSDIDLKLNILNGDGIGSIKTNSSHASTSSYSFAEGYETWAKGSGAHAEGYGKLGNIINVNGEANATTYTYEVQYSGNAQYYVFIGDYICFNNNFYQVVDAIYNIGKTTGLSFTVSTTLSTEGIVNETMTFRKGVASGQASHTEGMYNVASSVGAHAEGYMTHATGYSGSHAEGHQTNAFGMYGSHAEGRETKTIGDSSHAEGYFTEAQGSSSHAEGNGSKAIGLTSHSEGYYTTTVGKYSHSEGERSYAYGQASHAEGSYTVAIGTGSHAEGYTMGNINGTLILTGEGNALTYNYSGEEPRINSAVLYDSTAAIITHVDEQNQTITLSKTLSPEALSEAKTALAHCGAFGTGSHVEGYDTIACSTYQHVQGQRNIPDPDGKYAHIVGNGTASLDGSKNSNAHTLDWSGNGWYQGSVCVGGENGDAPAASLGANGLILTDETTGAKYRLFINNGEISTELLS